MLTELCAAVRELFEARACVLAAVRGDHVEFLAGDGDGVQLVIGTRLRIGDGIAGYIAQTGRPLEIADVPSDERWAANLQVHDEYVPGRLIGAPLVGDDGRVVGVLHVLDPSPDVAAEAQATVGSLLPVLGLVAADVARMLDGQTGSTSQPAQPVPDSV